MEDITREIRFYTLPELEKMLEEAGLNILEVYGDVDEREYDVGSRRLITVSSKSTKSTKPSKSSKSSTE